MIVRLYTGEDGQAHFEDLNLPAGDTETVALKTGADMTYRRFTDGSFSDWHNAPGFSTSSSCPAKWRLESETDPNGCLTQATSCKWKT